MMICLWKDISELTDIYISNIKVMGNKKEKKVNGLIFRSNFKNGYFIPNESINKWGEIDEVSLHLTRTAKYQVFIPGLGFYIPSKIKNGKAVLPKRMTEK